MVRRTGIRLPNERAVPGSNVLDTLARGAHALRLVAVALLAVLHALARRLHAPALEAVALGRVLHALVRVALAHMLQPMQRGGGVQNCFE